ncbi:C-C motif chemokine 24 isoform X2 [Mirounga angustirostris]|uniref:C-C motif chemokine 24 isoform X2 n=1 Tax=Mirounga leonina TaxID=9715 RepID=UPI00156C1F40|nr:C-C motif chemokine 24 isoform X2 [Mirounga leonina]XP_045731517.1 C-C motif chemokine 24 isoform X4 [Mirounga angustirostris]
MTSKYFLPLSLGAELLLRHMAGLATLGASLLLLTLCAHRIDPAGSVPIPSSCCISFISKKVPQNRVVSYQLSSASVCPVAGVIFTTRKGQKFCGDPRHPWVQKYMKKLDARQKTASPRVRAMRTKAPVQGNPGNTTSI